jgi:hypothetical protein
VQDALRKLFPTDKALVVHDLGASDGRLSMSWAKRIFKHFPTAHITASDNVLFLVEAIWNFKEVYILEPDGTPIQYTNAPFVVPLHARESIVYIINALVRLWAKRHLQAARACASAVRWNPLPDYRVVNIGQWSLRQIPLVHPKVLSFSHKNRFTIAQVDGFRPLPWKCDVIRAMNLYQPYAMSIRQIEQGVYVALDALYEGGVFIVGRTMEDSAQRNDVTVFQKIRGVAHVIDRLGRGFEFEDIVKRVRL